MKQGELITKWANCPKCKGRGTWLIDPFVPDINACVHYSNLKQCIYCVKAETYFQEHQSEPTGAALEEILNTIQP